MSLGSPELHSEAVQMRNGGETERDAISGRPSPVCVCSTLLRIHASFLDLRLGRDAGALTGLGCLSLRFYYVFDGPFCSVVDAFVFVRLERLATICAALYDPAGLRGDCSVYRFSSVGVAEVRSTNRPLYF